MMRHALGIDIGGTKILAGLVAETGAVLVERQVPTPAGGGADAVLAAVEAAAGAVLSQSDRKPVACGVGTAGVVDATGTIVSATDLIADWVGARIADRLNGSLGLAISVLNDVHAHGVGEARIGAAAGRSSALIVAVGTGIGGAVMRDGTAVHGASGIAGSIGHTISPLRRGAVCSCGAIDHVEAHASGPAIEAEYARRSGRRLGLRAIAGLDEANAHEVVREAGEALGAAIGSAVNLLDPELVVVGGGVAHLGDPLFAAMRAGFRAQAMQLAQGVAIVPARLGAQSCMVGAALAAMQRV